MADPAKVVPHQNWLRIHPLETQRSALLSQRIYSSIFWILITKENKKTILGVKKNTI
jgi:hypothetical protein